MGKKSKKKDETDDITLDFSFFKKVFSSKGTKTRDSEEDISVDLRQIISFIKKYGSIFLILIPLILSIYIRTAPSKLEIADEWARQGIYNNIRSNIGNQINQQYPNLPQQNREAMINEQFNTVLQQQNSQIETAVKQQSEIFRERFRDETGYTYLGDIDSYFWLRYARNIIEKGHIGDEIKDGYAHDNHMLAPEGQRIIQNIYPYIEAYLFKFLRIFNPKLILMQAGFLTPLFLSFFAIVAAFFIGRKLAGDLGGLIASVLIAVNPTVLSRSLGSDNDIVNAVFPLLIMLFVFLAFDTKNIKVMSIHAFLAGLILGVYNFTWSGWWFMYFFVLGASGTYIAYHILTELFNNNLKNILNNFNIRKTLFFILVFLVAAFISLSFFGNSIELIRSLTYPFEFIQIKQASRGISLWPNVYTTVAELNEANIPQIIGSLGGSTFLVLALIGSITSLVNFDSGKKSLKISLAFLALSAVYYLFLVQFAVSNNISILLFLVFMSLPLFVGLLLSAYFRYKIESQHSILLLIWFMATIFAATKGIRFILLIIPTFVISFSTFIGFVAKWFAVLVSKILDMNFSITRTIFVALALIVLIQPINNGYQTAYSYVPSVNDAWVETLTKIKLESKPDAIINSWWDFGHWFKFWADRAVTADGASQNKPQAHWVGKVLLTTNEEQAIAILRMLDCGANKAAEELDKITKDTSKSVDMIYSFFDMPVDDVNKELLKITTEQKAQEITSYIFCQPPENFFITSQDMVGKSGVWAHFGSWNFKRAKIYNYFKIETFDNFVNLLETDLLYTKDDAQRTYYELNSLVTDRQVNDWIASWPSYGGIVGCSKPNEEILQCNLPAPNNQAIPLQINLTTMEAYVNSNQGLFHPNAFGYFDNDNFEMKTYDENLVGYGIVLTEGNDIIFMAPELTGSMFTRLFYLDGKGLKYFNKFHDVTGVSGGRIITWKVDWPDA